MTSVDPVKAAPGAAESGLGVGEDGLCCGHVAYWPGAGDRHDQCALCVGTARESHHPFKGVKVWHDDGDECTGEHCINPAHFEAGEDVTDQYAPPSPPDTTPNPVPDQVLTPLSAEADLDDAMERTYAAIADNIPERYLAAIDAYTAAIVARERRKVTAVQASIEAVSAAARAYVDARSGRVALTDTLDHTLDALIAAALAGVPKEAGCFCGHEATDHVPLDQGRTVAGTRPVGCMTCFRDHLSGIEDFEYHHEFGVVAAPVEDAK